MKEVIRLSVIVPVYNVEPFVEACISSLLALDISQMEVLAINDGSTDGSLAVLESLAAGDGRMRVIDKPNSGYGATLNLGLEEARGTYIGILESDDVLYEDKLKTLLELAEREQASVAKGDFIYWWPTQEEKTHRAGEIGPDMCGDVLDTSCDLRIYARRSTIWSGIYHRDLIRKEGIAFLPTPGAAFQDTSFNFKVFACSHRSVFLDEPIVQYRQDNAQSSIHSRDKADAVRIEFDEIDRWLREHCAGPNCQGLLEESLIQRFNAYLWNADRLDESICVQFLSGVGRQFEEFERQGRFDPSSWDRWRLANLRSIQKDPERYMLIRRRYRGDSPKDKARFALALGGVTLLAHAIAEQARRR